MTCKPLIWSAIAVYVICPVAPDITLDPDDVETVEGMSVTFLCAATGRPRPTITWYTYDDSSTLEAVDLSNSRITLTEEEMRDREGMSNLTLRSVLPSDAADYICHADNHNIGSTRSNATLTVNGVWPPCVHE